MKAEKTKDCNYSCQTDPLDMITRHLACTPGMGVHTCYEDHWPTPPKLGRLGRGEWQGTMGSCMTKEQTADCQLTEDPFTYAWNPMYVVPVVNCWGRRPAQKEVSANIELHVMQKWLHGKLGAGRGARHVAEWLLMESCAEMEAPDGSFLIRECGTYVGDYVLSFWHCEKVRHWRIYWQQDTNGQKFFVTDTQVFDSLYDLVAYCWEMPVRYNGLDKAGASIQHSQQHRLSAAGWHQRDEPSLSAIYFRAVGKIQHCQMWQESHI